MKTLRIADLRQAASEVGANVSTTASRTSLAYFVDAPEGQVWAWNGRRTLTCLNWPGQKQINGAEIAQTIEWMQHGLTEKKSEAA